MTRSSRLPDENSKKKEIDKLEKALLANGSLRRNIKAASKPKWDNNDEEKEEPLS